MKSLNYFLRETPLSKGKFMARTMLTNIYNDNELISIMKNKDSALSETEIKKTLKILVESVQELLSQGIAVSVPNFLKITPAVKGIFDTPEEPFNPAKHWVGINCTIANSLIDDFQKAVKVEKVSKPLNWPDISAIYDCESEKNMIRTDFANRITGDFLIVAGHDIEGIIITSKQDMNQSIFIEVKDMGIVSYKTKELTFTINKTFAAPVWLIKDMDILVKIRYKSSGGNVRETDYFDSSWGG